jgi:hypothetical protein
MEIQTKTLETEKKIREIQTKRIENFVWISVIFVWVS